MKKLNFKKRAQKTMPGFTIIEVMLVLAITGLLLVGVLGGTYRNIEQQRYVDSYRSFAEYLRQIYNEVLSPESWQTDSGEIAAGRSADQAIYGKIIVFGLNSDPQHVYSATVVGNINISSDIVGFMNELKSENNGGNARLECNTVSEYTTKWESRILAPTVSNPAPVLKGALLIARSPLSGTINTRWTDEVFDISSAGQCSAAAGGNTVFQTAISNTTDTSGFVAKDVDVCVKSDASAVVRGIRIKANARNSSGINMLTEEDSLDLGTAPGGGALKCL